jgi:hypothetical protein
MQTAAWAPPTIYKKHATMGDTLRAMQNAANKGKKSLRVRRLVELITEGIAQGDYASEVLAIYYWVCRNIRYIRDIDGVEFIKEPDQVLATGAGDCDDMATLLAAMLMSAGNPVRFAVAGFKPGRPNFSHVYVEVMSPHGPVTIDPVANRDTMRMLRSMTFKDIVPVSQGPGTIDAGVGTFAAPQRHIGPDGGNLFSVYDYNRGLYDYYEASTGALPATGRYRKPLSGGVTPNGISPEAIAAKLPGSAKKVGSGAAPKGIIAARGLSGFGEPTSGAQMGTLAVFGIGVLVGFYLYSKLDSWSL